MRVSNEWAGGRRYTHAKMARRICLEAGREGEDEDEESKENERGDES